MPYIIVIALAFLTAYMVFTVYEWDEPSEEQGRTVTDSEGNKLYTEYKVKVYGRTYNARRTFVDEHVNDICPSCGGKVVPYEEEMWMGGHSTFYTMYGCDSCGRMDDDNFGVAGMRRVESSALEYVGPEPEVRPGPTKLARALFTMMAVLGCGAFVASVVLSWGWFWRIVGIGALLCGITGYGCLESER